MKHCELCKGLARTYCESDKASLCWNCDVKVHGANFLVARHTRSVLCHICQSPTPWKASGAELGVTVSVCESCVVGARNSSEGEGEDEDESQGGNDIEFDSDDDDLISEDDDADSDDDDADEDELDGDDEDGDNQVVPWSASSTMTPPPAASSSSSGESVSTFGNGGREFSEGSSLKRMREISSHPTSQDNLDRPFPKRIYYSALTAPADWSSADGKESSADSKPSKELGTETERLGQVGPVPRNASGLESLKRFRRQGSGAIDLNSAEP
ncbi:pheromone-processing carboxypeptidase KEX1-like [Humulus lupulus]|uniref:pheromone-processing carboxypeptidase KEX1-like n=1 Tax=Humulus lupulus TaxID=3486 RepID=UPI002B402758|nr:pheromone-processing carboxypeptidase KEX1-like [Humulus lupulus]